MLARKRKRKTTSQTSQPSLVELSEAGELQYKRVRGFFEGVLRHSKGEHAGKPFTLLPWQQEVFRNLFGVLNAEGRRQHRVSYIEVPKKNGSLAPAA